MSREKANSYSLNSFYVLVFGLMLVTGSGALLAAESDEQRTSVSRHIVSGGRDNPTQVAESDEEYDGLVTSGERKKSDTRAASAKGSFVAQKGASDFWFYEADVIRYNDDDQDGYYHGIDLLFDDTFPIEHRQSCAEALALIGPAHPDAMPALLKLLQY